MSQQRNQEWHGIRTSTFAENGNRRCLFMGFAQPKCRKQNILGQISVQRKQSPTIVALAEQSLHISHHRFYRSIGMTERALQRTIS